MARQYTEDDKATALAALEANDGNLKRTASELNIPRATLTSWRDGKGINTEVSEKCHQKKEALSGLFEQACRVYLQHAVAKATVGKTSGKDAMTAAAIAVDKMQLLDGKPPTINQNDYSHLTDAELAKRAADVEQRLRRCMNATAPMRTDPCDRQASP